MLTVDDDDDSNITTQVHEIESCKSLRVHPTQFTNQAVLILQ